MMLTRILAFPVMVVCFAIGYAHGLILAWRIRINGRTRR